MFNKGKTQIKNDTFIKTQIKNDTFIKTQIKNNIFIKTQIKNNTFIKTQIKNDTFIKKIFENLLPSTNDVNCCEKLLVTGEVFDEGTIHPLDTFFLHNSLDTVNACSN